MICPLKIDMYCNNSTETALHAAIKGKYYDIALALLTSGANTNLPIKVYLDYNEVNDDQIKMSEDEYCIIYILYRAYLVTR